MAPSGRRSLIRRYLKRSSNNLDHYLNNIHNAWGVAEGHNAAVSSALEGLARMALDLQEMTDKLYEMM
jgi:hypothetical protein